MGENDTLLEDSGAAAYLRTGYVTLGSGESATIVADYNGVALEEFSQGTWKLLDADSLTWYTYKDSGYLNAAFNTATDASTFGVDDLFYTSNLTFVANAEGDTAHRNIELTENVDLGIGRVQFSLGSHTGADGETIAVESATFDIGRESSQYFLSSAGYVVDKGVTVNNYFTYQKGRELRRTGEGVLNIVGTGNSDLLLNIGAGGLTYLNRENGYGVYSALVNTEAVLKLHDVGQVYNNVTLGAGGGVLDFNGNDFCWVSSGARATGSDGKYYFGLTVYEGLERVENSYVVNYASGTLSTITIEQGDFEFAGAFRDGSYYSTVVGGETVEWDARYTMMPELLIDQYTQFTESQRKDSASALRVVYAGHGTMTMTGVYTVLTGSNAQGESGFEVANGSVVLRGTNTIHSLGSESGTNHNRWQNPMDWHYAMAEMDVTVRDGAAFELGDHALLIGDVYVQAGGSFVMKQAVNERYEYVEGWYASEDTYVLSDYYGLKGNVTLEKGASMTLRFDEGVATHLGYAGSISGEGSLTVAAGEGSVTLSGDNSFSGEKTLESGLLRLTESAQGDTSRNKWHVAEAGALALESVSSNNDVLRLVAQDSTGVLALVNDFSQQLDVLYFPGLIVGAAAGESVHYGTAGEKLQSVNHRWTLGGGGGTLYVDFLLADNEDGTANKLVLGNRYGTGTVVLTNENNSFSGGIDIVGNITLEYTSVGALGGKVGVSYGNVLSAPGSELLGSGKLNTDSDGIFALSAEAGADDYDLSAHSSLSLAARGESTLTGTLTLAEGAAYRFGGSGTLTVATQLTGNHSLMIDAQGTSGSSVVLAKASAATGDVTVRGYDADRGLSEGDITLLLAADNALASSSAIFLENGATVDLGGTNQIFHALHGHECTLITDSSEGGNTLTLDYNEDSHFVGSVQIAGTDVVKTGAGDLTLSGEKLWKSLTIEQGSVSIADGTSIGYLASGSQDITVTVRDGATLHVTRGTGFTNELRVAGFGDGEARPYAVQVDNGTLSNTAGSFVLEGNAGISGSFSFRKTDLNGFDLYVSNGVFASSSLSGEGGNIILGAAGRMTTLTGSDYSVQIQDGAYVSLDRFSGGSSIGVRLEGGNFYMGYSSDASVATNEINNSSYQGLITVGEKGGLISNYTRYDKSFHLTGGVVGTYADSTLRIGSRGDSYARAIHVDSTMNLAGHVELENASILHLNEKAYIGGTLHIGSLATTVIGSEAVIGGLSGNGTLRLDGTGALMEVSGGAFNFAGTLDIQCGTAMFDGLDEGGTLGSLGALTLGENGILALSQIGGYTGESSALLNIGSLVVTEGGKLALSSADMETLVEGRYHLLSSTSELTGLVLANTVEGSRRVFELEQVGTAESGYTLDLVVTGAKAQALWQGSGTLIEGTANEANITTDLATEDYTFFSQDALTIRTAEGASETLTLGSIIHASTLIYDGAGTMTLAQENDGMFSRATILQMTGTGTLDLGNTTAVGGEVVMQSGTLRGTGSAINATSGLKVTGDATLALTDTTAVDRSFDISATLDLQGEGSGRRTLSGTLTGTGTLAFSGDELLLKGNAIGFTGTLAVDSGTLRLGDSKNLTLHLGAEQIRVASGATLKLNAYALKLTSDIDWANGSVLYIEDGNGSAAATSGGGYHYLLTGDQTLAGRMNLQYYWGKSVAIEGIIRDAAADTPGSLLISGWGGISGGSSLTLYGENTYSGGTTISSNQVTAYAANTRSFGTGAITLTNGTLSWKKVGEGWDGDLAAALVLGNGSLNTNGFNINYSNSISGSGHLNKAGSGSLTLTGELSYTGTTNVNAGSLVLDSKLASTANVNVAAGAGLVLKGANLNGNTVNLNGSLGGYNAAVSGTAEQMSSAGSYQASSYGYLDITAGGELSANLSAASGGGLMVLASSEALNFSGTASGNLMLSLVGKDFTLSGSNTHSGGTEFSGETLTLASANALGSGALYAIEGSTVQVAEGIDALIAGNSTVDELAFAEGSRVSVGAEGTAGTLHFNSTSGAAHFELDIYGLDSYDKLVGDIASGTQLGLNLHSSTVGSYQLVEGKVAPEDITLTLSGAAHDSNAYTYGYDYEKGLTLTIDYNHDAINLWTGASGDDWDASSGNWNGGSAFNANMANTLFRVSSDMAVDVVGAQSTTTLITEVGEAATLTFNFEENAGMTARALVKEGAGSVVLTGGSNNFGSVEVNAGTLVAHSAAALGSTKVTGAGTLSLMKDSYSTTPDDMAIANISLSDGATLDMASNSTTSGRNLMVGSNSTLRLGFWGNLNNSSLSLSDGGQLVLGSVGLSNNAISVDEAGSIAVGQTTEQADYSYVLDINSDIRGTGTLSLLDYTAKSSTGYTVNVNREIANGDGASLALVANQSDLHLRAANSYSGGTTLAGGKLTLHHADVLGTGALTVTDGTLALEADVHLRGLSGTGGSIVGNNYDLRVSQSSDGRYEGSLSGVDDFVKTGEASLTIDTTGAMSVGSLAVEQGTLTVGQLTISEALTMTVYGEGSSLSIGQLTMGDGTQLIYNDSALATVDSFTALGALTLDLDGIAALLLDADGAYDLGLNLSAVTDLTVKGLQSSEYVITHEEGGNSFISLTDSSTWVGRFRSVSWDESWSTVWDVTNLPTMARKVHLEAALCLKGSEYDQGGSIDIAIDSTEGDTLLNLRGTATAAVNADLWVDITAGNFDKVVMGSDNGVSFDGDTHLQASGGSFNTVIGGNWGRGSFTGDTFITLGGEAQVHGLIVGGSYVNATNSSISFTGNSHINIRNLQPADGDAMTSYLSSDFVAGAHVVADLSGSTVRFDGNTHVGVYLDDAVEGSFSRNIVGGNVSMGGSAGSSLSHAHVGSVFLHVGNKVLFDKVVAGGHYAGNAVGQFSITGMSQLTISGGHYTNSVTAGTYLDRVSGVSSVDIASSSLQISGGLYDGEVSGGAHVRIGSASNTTFTLDDVRVFVSGGHLNKGLTGGLYLGNTTATVDIGTIVMELSGGTYNGDITGGVHAATATTRTVTGSVENVDITISGATVNGNIYGGGFLAREASGAELSVGNVGISIYSGSINGNIYAAGVQRGDSALVVGSTSVTLGPSVSYADGIIVSGGFETGQGTVTGTRELTLQGTTQTVENEDGTQTVYGGYYSGMTVRDFDRVTNAGDVDIARLEGDKDIHKAGDGTLTVRELGENSRLVLDAGALRLNSVANLTSVSGSGALILNTQGAVQAGAMMQTAAGLTGSFTMESGTLDVSGTVQTLSQGIRFDGAGLSMADGANLGGSLSLERATNAVVEGAATLSADISGAGLTVSGTGALTLSGSNSMESLAVNSGTLVAASANALGSGDVTVASGASLTLDAAVSGLSSLTLADGATLALSGSLAGQAVLTAQSLNLGENLTLSFNGELTAGDTFTLAGAFSSETVWNIETELRSSISVDTTADSITFTVNSVGAASLVWAGGEASAWNNEATNTVWTNAGNADHFVANDLVTFGDEGNKTVAVADVQAGSINFTVDGYQLNGGSITTGAVAVQTMGHTAHVDSVLRSEADMTYSGAGMLVLEAGQDIAGSLDIQSGYVQILHSAGLHGGVDIAENGTLVLNMAGQEWQGGSIIGTGAVDLMGIYNASDLVDAFVLTESGGSFKGTISMEGGSSFIMDADSTSPYADVTFLVEQGSSFVMNTAHTLASDIVMNFNGFLDIERDATLAGTITVEMLGTLHVNQGVKATFSGRLEGSEESGELTMLGGGLLEIGGLQGTGSLLVEQGDLSVNSAASIGKLTLVGGNTLSLVHGQLLTVRALELGGQVAVAFSGELTAGETYTLLESGTGLADIDLSKIALSTDLRRDYELSIADNRLQVTIGERLVGNFVWAGDASDNVWDRSVFHKQWDSDNDGTADTSFFNQDSVTFASGGTHTVVVGKDGVEVADMLLTGSGYSFSGGAITAAHLTDSSAEGRNTIAGNLAVSGALSKTGAGTLELTGDNSFGSVELAGGRLVAGSDHALGHDAEVAVSNGAELFVADNANVHNTLSGGSYIIGAEAGQQGSFTGGAAASLVSSGFTKQGEGRVELVNESGDKAAAMLINEGTLAYHAGSSTRVDSVTGDGVFELIGGTLTVTAEQLGISRVHLNGGAMVSESTLSNRSFELSQGSSLQMNWNSSLLNSSLLMHEGTEFRIGNSTFSGNLEVDGNATLVMGCWNTCAITAAIEGAGTLRLSHWSGNQSTLSGVIADGANGPLALQSDHNNVVISGANTYTGGTTITSGRLATNNASALGTGAVMLTGGTLRLNRDLEIGTLSGTGGTVDFSTNTLTVNQAEDAGYTGLFSGSGKLVKTGEGMLTFDRSHYETDAESGETVLVYDLTELGSLEVLQGAVDARNLAISGTLYIDMVEGAGMRLDSLTMRDGATLSYSGTELYADIRSFAADGALSLDLSNIFVYLSAKTDGAYNVFDLGLDLSQYESALSVVGQESGMYTIGWDAATGHSTIQLTDTSSWVVDYRDVVWDTNWQVENAPTRARALSLSENSALFDIADCHQSDSSLLVATVTATDGMVNLAATLDSDTNNQGGTLEADAWLMVEGGSFGIVSGANINNWDSGSLWNVTGDIHLMLKAGSANEVVGLSHKDARRPVFTGNSYISIGEGFTVNDSVIGGGVARHNSGMELTGSTHVFVYGVQSENPTLTGGDSMNIGTRYNAIIGGHAYGSNNAVTFNIGGSTNVAVDLSGYTGASTSFVKAIYGGNASNSCNSTIGEGSNVSITAGGQVSFTANIAAGSYKVGGSGSDTINGNTTLTINGGSFTGSGTYLTGGSIVSGGSSVITGTASVILHGGTINRDVYAAGISTGGSSTVGSTLVQLDSGVNLGNVVLSGGFSRPANGTVTGERVLSLGQGAIIGSGVTVRDFSRIHVESGSASLAAEKVEGSFSKTGSGELSLSGTNSTDAHLNLEEGRVTLRSDVVLGSLSGLEGTKLDIGSNTLYINQSIEGSYAGAITGGSLTKLGDASLHLSSLTIGGTLTAGDSVLTIDALTLKQGAVINYNTLNTAVSAGSFTAQGAYTIGIKSVVDSMITVDGTYTVLDLGMDMSQSLSYLSVEGLTSDMYTIGFNESSGHSTLTLTDAAAETMGFKAVSWDANWGAVDAPQRVWQEELTATGAFAGSSYDNGECIALTVGGTSGVVDLFATVNLSATGAAAVTLERDIWVEVTDGTFGVIAGAYLNNWNNASSGFIGDWHYQIRGGSVNDVIGLSYKDAKQPSFVGNTYISVYEGATINDSVIGGAELQHNAGAQLTGNTNVYIYDVLDTNPTSLSGSKTGQRYNAVIGGHAYGANQHGGKTMSIDGSTNVLVDVSQYEGEATTFVKSIYGGHVRNGGELIGTITQGTHVDIRANELVSFSENIVGGSRVNSNSDTIGVGTTLSIDGGVYTGGTDKFITAGSWVTGGTSKIDGTATLILTGDTEIQRHVYVAGYSGGGNSTVGATRLEIGKDVTFRGTGIKISGGFTSSSRGTVGDRTLALHDGVDLNANSDATLENFSHIEVAQGLATISTAQANQVEGFIKTGAGTLALTGAGTSSYALTLTEGTLQYAGQAQSGNLSFAGDSSVKVTGSLSLTGKTIAYSGTGTAEMAAAITNSTGRMVFDIASAGKGSDFVEFAATGNIGTDSTIEFGMDKKGAGTMMLSGTNVYAWGTNVQAGCLIAASDSALGVGSLDVAAGATLDIASGTHAQVQHYINLADGAELRLHELSTEQANLSTDGSRLDGWSSHSALGAFTLTLAEDTALTDGTGYKLISLEANSSIGTGTNVSINYQGDGRYTFTTRVEDNTLLLDVAKQAAAALVWAGTSEADSWTQSAQNLNWNEDTPDAASTSFMNGDTVSFTDDAAHKNVHVDAAGVQVQEMAVSGTGYSFSGGEVKSTRATVGEEIRLNAGASLALGDVFTVNANQAENDATLGKLEMSSDYAQGIGSIRGTGGEALSTIDNAVIDITKGMTLTLEDVILTQTSRVTDDPATVLMNNTVIEIGSANTQMEADGSLAAGQVLRLSGSETETLTLGANATVCNVLCSSLDTVNVAGGSLTLDLSALGDALKGYDYVAISFGDSSATLAHFDATGLSITATLDGQSYSGAYVMDGEQANATTIYIPGYGGAAVPEPTTATLSLLALAALAMRRRRSRG